MTTVLALAGVLIGWALGEWYSARKRARQEREFLRLMMKLKAAREARIEKFKQEWEFKFRPAKPHHVQNHN